MAASSARKTDALIKMLAFALIVIVPLFNGVMAQEDDDEVVTGTTTAVRVAEFIRGDGIAMTTKAPSSEEDPQVMMLPTMGPSDQTTEPTDQTTAAEMTGDNGNSGPGDIEVITAGENTMVTDEVPTDTPKVEPETQPPMPPRGDGPNNNIPQLVPRVDVVCVSKEAVQDKNAVSLKLKAPSTCEDTKVKIESVLEELCGEDCKLEIYQEDNTDDILVSGKYVEDDVAGMANKFNNDNIKDKTDVEEAVARWGKNSKLVLVSLLLAGLLLAALLMAGYYLKTHRKNSKGVRLADTFQVDEENQANTLVSVAPLPQEPLDKPTVNGESPPENGNNPAPTTNGHSATQTPVADTEM
ncbi:hematopoietic progenitor cell antigen CD34 isoform X2 [Labrus bergylta]|uniref:hematopoietic progenitor cell antigen CD34 isoform X2 n=1 Tax=Labrus bergylta TaxID=56723 RepID=UPI0009B4A3D5